LYAAVQRAQNAWQVLSGIRCEKKAHFHGKRAWLRREN
jgi:hypothetical protein